jgi:hypothetical protein
MDSSDLSHADWRKSSYSANGGNCVEVAQNLAGVIAVRDSKNPHGSPLAFTPRDWDRFTFSIKNGDLSLD